MRCRLAAIDRARFLSADVCAPERDGEPRRDKLYTTVALETRVTVRLIYMDSVEKIYRDRSEAERRECVWIDAWQCALLLWNCWFNLKLRFLREY